MSLVNGNVGVLNPLVGPLDDDLLHVTLVSAEEGDGVVPGAGGRHGRQLGVESQDGCLGDGHLPAQRRVEVEATKVLADLLELCLNATDAGRDEGEASLPHAGETALDVGHELAPDGLQ